ncbi:MAG: DUF349 domain-containing protein [Thermonemataceae bacterium]|nr:DUF349 domain-containing protein [Thermonemataceae bacterium]
MIEDENVLGNQEELVNSASESHISEPEEHQEDYSTYSKEQLLAVAEKYQAKNLNPEEIDEAFKTFKQLKPAFDNLVALSKEEALQKFLASGGDEDSFTYKQEASETKFYQIVGAIRKQRIALQEQIEKNLKKNLTEKNEIIDKLRNLIHAEEEGENTHKQVRELQQDWKKIGAVPKANAKTLWASYNALMEMYYSRLTVYNELKDLDRKRNLEAKTLICEKAEKLLELETIKEAIKQLNELHEEFKHIGPVGNKEEQELIWKRFKDASDALYTRKKELLEVQKTEMNENLAKKEVLCQKAQSFESFQGEKIKNWQEATQQLLDLQKEWESIGQMPLEKSKEVTKKFWDSFKVFFRNKSEFFKGLDEMRDKNLQEKTNLCQKAEALVEAATDETMESIAEELKKLQEQWKAIGAVPEKKKEEIFERFRNTLDSFFEKRRSTFSAKDKEEKDNYEKKNALCERLKGYSAEDLQNMDLDSLAEQVIAEWKTIGFVPHKQIGKIKEKFYKALKGLVDTATHLSQDQKDMLDLSLELKWAALNGKGGSKDLGKKEQQIRKRITQLEDEIATLNNNLGFFASSKQIDSLRNSIDDKVKQAENEIKTLKNQLRMIRNLS